MIKSLMTIWRPTTPDEADTPFRITIVGQTMKR
jgi:hypothetical protein